MWVISPSFLFLCCFFFFLFLAPTENLKSTFYDDIINQTCKICANASSALSYSSCSSSLQVIPVSHATNLNGLAIISMELALANATDTISSITELLSYGPAPFTPFAFACLEDCLELYTDSVVTLLEGVAALLKGRYGTANMKVSAVMEASTTCEEGFGEKEGEVSPLTMENYNLFQLCDIAICIIHLLSLGVHST